MPEDTETHTHLSCFECGFALFILGEKPYVPDIGHTGEQCCTCGRDLLLANLSSPNWNITDTTSRSN